MVAFNIAIGILAVLGGIVMAGVLVMFVTVVLVIITSVGNSVCKSFGYPDSYLNFSFRDLIVGLIVLTASSVVLYYIGAGVMLLS